MGTFNMPKISRKLILASYTVNNIDTAARLRAIASSVSTLEKNANPPKRPSLVDTVEGRSRIVHPLTHSVGNMGAKVNIMKGLVQKCKTTKSRKEFRDTLYRIQDILETLKGQSFVSVVQDLIGSVKMYERSRGRELQ